MGVAARSLCITMRLQLLSRLVRTRDKAGKHLTDIVALRHVETCRLLASACSRSVHNASFNCQFPRCCFVQCTDVFCNVALLTGHVRTDILCMIDKLVYQLSSNDSTSPIML